MSINLIDIIPLIGIIFTTLLTVFIKINSNPFISYGTKTRNIKLEDYNIAYDIISASFISYLSIVIFSKNSNLFNHSVFSTIIATDLVFTLAFVFYIYFYIYFMKRLGWSKTENEELSKVGVLLSSFFTITSLYFLYYLIVYFLWGQQ